MPPRAGPKWCVARDAVLAYSHDVDDLGLRLRHLAKPTQLDKKRFELEWVLPLEPGLSTHVTLYDLEQLLRVLDARVIRTPNRMIRSNRRR